MALTNTFTASTEIRINGEAIRRVNYLRIGQRFDSHHDFEISVSPDMLSNRAVKLKELADKFVGKNAAITLKQGREGSPEQSQIFSGIVTSVRLVKGQSQASTFLISGLSPTVLLAAGPTTRCFIDKSLSDIVSEVLKPFPFSSISSPKSSASIAYITQYEEDNFHFLQRLAEEFGEWVFYDGDALVFGKNGRQPSTTISLTHGVNLFDMEYGLRVTPLSFRANYFNYEGCHLFKAHSSSEQVEGLSSFSQLTFNRSNEVFTDELNQINFTNHATEASLKTAVKLKKSEQANKLAVFTGRSPEMEMKIGGLVSITEPVFVDGKRTDTIDYGTFVITRLNHFVDARGVYQANFEAIPQETDFAPVDYRIVAPMAKPQIAQVKDLKDPLKLGRVKVKFGWQEEGQTTPFIRVSSMMTGSSKSYFIPEFHDLVMIDFEYGNPDLPFVVGGMYADDNGPLNPGEQLFKPDNHIKGIITRGGNHIIIDDSDGKEKIQIFNKENKNKIELSLDGGSHINIHSNGTINMSANKIVMKAKELIEMESDGDIKIKAKADLKTEADNIEMKAKTNANVEATSGLELKGATAKMEATAGLELKGTNAKVEASAVLELKGGATTILKGGMVMIN